MTTITIKGSVTFDESSGLQNSGIPVTGEDNNDNDVAFKLDPLHPELNPLPTAFSDRLFGATELKLDSAFATARGVGHSANDFITVSDSGAKITALGFVDGNGKSLPVFVSGGDPTLGVLTSITTEDGSDAGTAPDNVYLFADPELGDRMVLGVDSSGDIAFSLFLDPNGTLTSAGVWIVQFEPIAN